MSDPISYTLKALCRTSPAVKRWILVTYYNFLARRFQDPEWTFMNYGYDDATPPDDASAASTEASSERHCARLYQHVAGHVPLAGCSVLEVGCGRGGGCECIRRELRAGQVVGLDFAAANIALCQLHHGGDGMMFVVGDAMHLPFPCAAFDAVVNIESSHCYPSVPRFLKEVRRVLRPGGHLLFADLRTAEAMPALIDQMHDADLFIMAEVDISTQVIRALDADSERKERMIARSVPRWLHRSFREFSAVKGSGNYRKFKCGELVYRRFVLQALDGAVPSSGGGA